MGLDMYLTDPKTEEDVGYWRKANAIHHWFVTHCQDGVDDGQTYAVSVQQLKTLRRVCVAVLDNHDLAPALLPTKSGFFFGGTAYDEWYFHKLSDTVKILTDVLESASEDGYVYWAWW